MDARTDENGKEFLPCDALVSSDALSALQNLLHIFFIRYFPTAMQRQGIPFCNGIICRCQIMLQIHMRHPFDAQKIEHHIVNQVIRPIGLLVSPQLCKRLWAFLLKLIAEPHHERYACHGPGKFIRIVPQPTIRIVAMVRKINHSFEIWQRMNTFINLGKDVVIIPHRVIVSVYQGVLS